MVLLVNILNALNKLKQYIQFLSSTYLALYNSAIDLNQHLFTSNLYKYYTFYYPHQYFNLLQYIPS